MTRSCSQTQSTVLEPSRDLPLDPQMVAHLRSNARFDDTDIARHCDVFSSAGLDTAPHQGDDGLFGKHLEGFLDLSVGEGQGFDFVIPLCGCGRDLNWSGRHWTCGESASEESPGTCHVAAIGDCDLDSGVEQKFREAFDDHQLGNEGSLGSLIHVWLQRLKALIKTAFGRAVQ